MSLPRKIRQEKTIRNRWQRRVVFFFSRRENIDQSTGLVSIHFCKEVKACLCILIVLILEVRKFQECPSRRCSCPSCYNFLLAFVDGPGGFIVMRMDIPGEKVQLSAKYSDLFGIPAEGEQRGFTVGERG